MKLSYLFSVLFLLFVIVNIFVFKDTTEIFGMKQSRYGSCGILKTDFKSVSNDPKVFFVGNSVYYSTPVLKELDQLNKKGNVHFQIGNFGYPGSSIYDYLFTYRHVRQFNPDILVVQLNPVTFGYTWPKFRNDSYRGIFQPHQASLLKESFVRDLFDKDLVAESLLASYFPFFRDVRLISWEAINFLKAQTKEYTAINIWSFFPARLNLAGEWGHGKDLRSVREKERQDEQFIRSTQYESAEEALRFLLTELEANNQKAIFINQATSFINVPIIDKLNAIFSDYPSIILADHSDFFSKKYYSDDIHPNVQGAKKEAKRHYDLIQQVILQK